ncbi:hypothetical protein BEWA_030570 [Theileria equi strain WA]|uniref:TFIIS N-terminal domain-containing protein n=1 Tax=Theileria equi strain WA TaxID=1537102 RepID=L0AZ73_THEEQ|nr:hypothetical protein BEWA_030570 [Theileria equi strain WA]AFZ80204.1 hypothetical protein BEWA_030570 [Theileria equi strain WA]|eukprot:XP_004829870.1 hypothetical protein BEWA_030570 [Theileria equi strain WA]
MAEFETVGNGPEGSQPTSGDSAAVFVFLKPNPEKCLSRVASLSKVDGLDQSEIEILNGWYVKNWGNIYAAGFQMDDVVTREFTAFMEANYSSFINVEKVESYLSVHRLLYRGLRQEFVVAENVSSDRLFQRYYYSCRENPVALNSLVILSNLIWSMRKFRHDLFAIACLVDVMLQAYLAALASFIHLGGVDVIKDVLYDLAQKGLLKDNVSLLTKCMDLLEKLDISFKVLQTSKIGIPVNGIASGGYNQRLGINFECGCDKVKLKATNLIKKWKAIRDASVGPVVQPDVKKAKPAPAPIVHSGPRPKSAKNDPFVLSIINTMVEQKEKEKRRKIEIRNSQMNSKFRSTKSSSVTEGPVLKVDGARLRQEPSTQDHASDKSVEDSRLASLANFFKAHPVAGVSASSNHVTNIATNDLMGIGTVSQSTVDYHSSPEGRKRRSRFSDAPPVDVSPGHNHVNFYASPSQDHDAPTTPPWKG